MNELGDVLDRSILAHDPTTHVDSDAPREPYTRVTLDRREAWPSRMCGGTARVPFLTLATVMIFQPFCREAGTFQVSLGGFLIDRHAYARIYRDLQ